MNKMLVFTSLLVITAIILAALALDRLKKPQNTLSAMFVEKVREYPQSDYRPEFSNFIYEEPENQEVGWGYFQCLGNPSAYRSGDNVYILVDDRINSQPAEYKIKMDGAIAETASFFYYKRVLPKNK